LKLPPFALHRPESVGQASRLLADLGDEGAAYCGGTELLLAMKLGLASYEHLVDLKRVDEAVTTIMDELRKIAAEPVPADELEKARSYAKGRFVLSLESPQGTNMFGLRREVLEGQATEPSEVLAELDKVTAEDVQRVGQDLMREDAFRLALIGPFDDAGRFEKLLD